MICSDLSIDSNELINLANHHPRVNILRPGCGVGGHCIAIDPWFLINNYNNKKWEQEHRYKLMKQQVTY